MSIVNEKIKEFTKPEMIIVEFSEEVVVTSGGGGVCPCQGRYCAAQCDDD